MVAPAPLKQIIRLELIVLHVCSVDRFANNATHTFKGVYIGNFNDKLRCYFSLILKIHNLSSEA